MRCRPLRCLAAVVAVAGLALAAACGTTPHPAAPAADAPPATGPTIGSVVHLTDYTDNDGPTSTVILAGAVGDYGTARSVDSTASPDHRGQLVLTLAHGSFRLDIAVLDQRFAAAMRGMRVDTTTCSATASVTDAVPIVSGSGTGAYQGIRGSFRLTATLDEVYRPGACDQSTPYLAQTIVTTGPGTVSFG